ncbi:PREDICTED: uncharacterized protein LOC108563313 [Nicrophorus vespilloides]|uniref:Uncharacterized protein LOC108563313 n=1 Tax=Nicrophorus vespilloides TaxID=110193 RepID=A0ABM1MS89_NICVS|nr:PREDICTED: uncharacterized protein LOC108563313 [Nicrophorus vespilloides]XP_017777437.1 PREDICTED: uncharacterized protein LOC108563313 [Nicrophorus vespilloides]XP_017777439.1 PREDICTED: uncharacterized protein LOC108563313 [Nicrophorus vespilloides]
MQSLKKLLNIGNLYIFFYIYGTFKHSKLIGQLHWIILLPLSLICTIFLCLMLIILAIYYEIINFVLRLKHGDDYCGIMDGSDVIWVVEEETSSLIKTLIMVDAKDGEDCEPLFEFIKSSYEKIAKSHKKMSWVRKYFMGYGYFLKTHINIHEHVRYLEDYKDVEGLNLLMDKLSDSPLPAGNTALWEVYVGRVPLKWDKNGGKVQYPIFTKYHHSLGDGMSLMTLITTQLIDNGVNIMKESCETYSNVLKKSALKKSQPTFLENVKKLLNKSYYITYFGLLDDKDENMLHQKRLSNEKHICYSLEKESTNYVEKVKSIKNRFKGISFNDVIMSAFSASCAEYYMCHDKNPPENIRFVLPYYIASTDFNSIVTTGTNGEIVANLKNNFALGFLNIPIKDKDIARNMVDRLMCINKNSTISKDSLDFPFVYWQINVFSTIVPLLVIKEIVKSNHNTVVLTNFPGIHSVNLISGHRVRDSLVWGPNVSICGITCSIYTYDGLFRFGLVVDKKTIKKRSEVQAICDNIFKYIDLLDTTTSAVHDEN